MTRARAESVRVKPTNNVYTALTGAAVVACGFAVVLLYLAWQDVTGGGVPLFFGLF